MNSVYLLYLEFLQQREILKVLESMTFRLRRPIISLLPSPKVNFLRTQNPVFSSLIHNTFHKYLVALFMY